MQIDDRDFHIPDHVTWKKLDKGFVLLDLNSSNYYTLNETASLIWQSILDEKPKGEIPAIMARSFTCSQAECLQDIQDQIDYLLEEKLLQINS